MTLRQLKNLIDSCHNLDKPVLMRIGVQDGQFIVRHIEKNFKETDDYVILSVGYENTDNLPPVQTKITNPTGN